jgi:outer membrane protein W
MQRAVWLPLLLLLSAPLFAQSSLTFFVTWQQNGGSSPVPSDDGLDLTVSFDDSSGLGAAYARVFGSRFSGEVAVFSTTSDLRVSESAGDSLVVGDIDLMPITAMLRIHLRRDGPFDAYAAAGAAYAITGDVDVDDPDRLTVDDVLTLAIGAGASWNFTPRLGLVLDARYLPLTLSPRAEGQDIDADMDPMLLSAGVRIRF